MSIVNINPGQTTNISSNDTGDQVVFSLDGTLNIAGTQANPITVTLDSVAGVGVLDTINISNATVMLDAVGATALTKYNIGAGATLQVANTVGVSAGLGLNFAAPGSHLVLSSGLNLSVLSGISGFAPGSSIDVSGGLATNASYTDALGSNTGGLLTLRDSGGNTVGRLTLTTGDYTASSFMLSPDGHGGTLVGFGALVTGTATSTPSGDIGIGGTVNITVATNNPVTVVGGTPTLTLNDGGVATYSAGLSTPTAMVFTHTVQAGQNAADLAVTAANLNGAVVTDAGGLPVSLAGAVGNPAGILQIDGTPPTVTSLSTSLTSGTLGTGETVAIDVGTSEAVSVHGGTPTLALSDGGVATYDSSASTATNLVFTHTVAANQSTPDLAVTGLSLNGATVTDLAGNQADLSGAIGNPAGTLPVAGMPPNDVSSTPMPGNSGSFGNGGGDPGSGGIAGAVTPGSASFNPTTIDVYRFFDTKFGTHFYTSDPSERQAVLQSRPDLVAEGPGGVGLEAVNPASNDPNAVPVFRFFDTLHGTHFFTASTAERDSLIATRSDLTYEAGSTFYEHATAQAGDTAVYRFFDSKFGTHFYTDSQSERATILQTRPDLVSEGIGFYEPARNPAS